MTARVGSTFSTLDSKCFFHRFSFGLALSPTKQQQHHKLKVSVTSSAQQPHVMTSPRSTGQNPWQLSPPCAGDVLGAVTSADVKTVSFSGIMRDETRQKESLQKLTNKPLHLIQVSHNFKKIRLNLNCLLLLFTTFECDLRTYHEDILMITRCGFRSRRKLSRSCWPTTLRKKLFQMRG